MIFLQTSQTPIRAINPSSLLDSICWSVSEPTSTASIYTESSSVGDVSEHQTSIFFDANGDGKESEASFANFSRPLTERLVNISTHKLHNGTSNSSFCSLPCFFLQRESRVNIQRPHAYHTFPHRSIR